MKVIEYLQAHQPVLLPQNISKPKVIVVFLLLVGIIVGVILVQQTQIFKSRADQRLYNAIEVTDSAGNLICSGNECNTDSLDVNVYLNIQELERLKNE